MGRRKGSKNKPKENTQKAFSMEENTLALNSGSPAIKRGRGRPAGSKNKPEVIKESTEDMRKIRREIKDLIAEKRALPRGSKDKKIIRDKIKELKAQLTNKKEVKAAAIEKYLSPERKALIEEINQLDPFNKRVLEFYPDIYDKLSDIQLQHHIDILKKKAAGRQ